MAQEKEATGIRRAAVFLVSIDQESAARVLSHVGKEEQERLALEISRLDAEPPTKPERDTVLRDFYNVHLAQQYVPPMRRLSSRTCSSPTKASLSVSLSWKHR